MIAANKNLFSFLEFANLDSEKATNSCLWPAHSLMGRLFGVMVVPLIAFASIVCMWLLMRKYRYEIRKHHLQRGAIQVVRFSFAPVTRKCLELLVCQKAFDRTVLSADQAKVCWVGTHTAAATLAIMLLFTYVVIIPSFWLYKVKHFLNKINHNKSEGIIDPTEGKSHSVEHAHANTVWVGCVVLFKIMRINTHTQS